MHAVCHSPYALGMAAECVLGVDGGGTGTTAVLVALDRTELARGKAGPSNYVVAGAPAAAAAVVEAIVQALRAAPAPVRIRTAAFCLAGIAGPADAELLRAALRAVSPPFPEWAAVVERARLTHDALAALTGGCGQPVGVVVVAGTGSIAYGRAADGREQRAGGWGWLAGDEGSAFDLGRRALQAAARAVDGRGPATALTELLLAEMGCGRMEELVRRFVPGPELRSLVAALAPLVFRAAAGGDAVAQDLLSSAARELALAAATVLRGLGLERIVTPVVMHGGLFQHHPPLREEFAAALARWAPMARPVLPQRDAAYGAALLALEPTW